MASHRIYPERHYTAPLPDIDNSETEASKPRREDDVKPLPKRRDTMGKLLAFTEEENEKEGTKKEPEASPENKDKSKWGKLSREGQTSGSEPPVRSETAERAYEEGASILVKSDRSDVGRRKPKQTLNFQMVDQKEGMVLSHWMLKKDESDRHRRVLSQYELMHSGFNPLDSMYQDEEKREDQMNEVKFIIENFKERRCTHFCKSRSMKDRIWAALKKCNFEPRDLHCKCGLERKYHRQSALENEINHWSATVNTELVYPHCFGNVDVPNHVNYLETPEGTRKYLRLDDLKTKSKRLWELLSKTWKLKAPNMILSVTGGDVTELQQNPSLQQKFRDGLLKTAVTTDAWVLTEGLHSGSSAEVGAAFQENLKMSEWAEREDHANIPLIGIPPWGIVGNRTELLGVNLGAEEAEYHLPTWDAWEQDSPAFNSMTSNALDPAHTIFLFPDDGTVGRYEREPKVRRDLEYYIKNETYIQMMGSTSVKTPLVILVLGGDGFTIQKVAEATNRDIPVVVVNGSGAIANIIAELVKKIGVSGESAREGVLKEVTRKYKPLGVLKSEDSKLLSQIMSKSHLIEICGKEDGDTSNLDKAVLRAIFSSVSEITIQLSLCLAVDRVDIAKEYIFKENRKHEIKSEEKLLQDALFLALKRGRAGFVHALLDQDHGGQLDFEEFLSIHRLFLLHKSNLSHTTHMGKLLLSLCKKDSQSRQKLDDYNLLSQIGRIIYLLMGDYYKLLYQEVDFERVKTTTFPWHPSMDSWEEAVWHLFLWAVLGNKKEIAELFLSRCTCKIGAALVGFKMLQELSNVAKTLAEIEMSDQLMADAEHFQDVAIQTLTQLYDLNRNEAYSSLVAAVPFNWGHDVTPISIADDAGAMRFMGHACCQTFLNLVWMKYMDLDTPKWKLFPLFVFFPYLVIPFIKFNQRSLSFGSYDHDVDETKAKENRQRNESINAHERNLSSEWGDAMDSDQDEGSVVVGDLENRLQIGRKRAMVKKFLKYSWFCLHNYFTAPVIKFGLHLLSYVVLLCLFTHFVLVELRHVDSIGDVTTVEWLIMFWILGHITEEAWQLLFRKGASPMYAMRVLNFGTSWNDTWYIHERALFFIGWYKVQVWLGDRWNQMDGLMIGCFIASAILRFLMPEVDFYVVRLMYCITLMLFYFRILRYGYILQELGPRIITIRAMIKDLIQFMLIIAVFIISFGIAFQGMLDPNRPISLDLVVDIVWRPYWQMYGELFLEDIANVTGQIDNRTCVLSRALAAADPVTYRLCHGWVVPIMLAIYMLITNILLLNLLIAIFSHSFEIIEAKSEMIWRYNLYDLVHEYYHLTFLPPPANLLIHAYLGLKWVINRLRYLSFKVAKWRHRRNMEKDKKSHLPPHLESGDAADVKKYIDRRAEHMAMQDMCGCFYYSRRKVHNETVSHFCQADYMRDEDVENKAYKRYVRMRTKQEQDPVTKSLKNQSERLQLISVELLEMKQRSSLMRRGESSLSLGSSSGTNALTGAAGDTRINRDIQRLGSDVNSINSKVDALADRVDLILDAISTNHTTIRPVVPAKPGLSEVVSMFQARESQTRDYEASTRQLKNGTPMAEAEYDAPEHHLYESLKYSRSDNNDSNI